MSSETLQYGLNGLLETEMNIVIDKEVLAEIFSKDPFIAVPGVVNIRDIGINSAPYLCRGLVYRSGALQAAPETSVAVLRDQFCIKLIIDMRSEKEIARAPNPTIGGVKSIHLDPTKLPTPIDMNDFLEEGGKVGYVKMYGEILKIYQPSIKVALEWIRDEGTPLLFHCTAGKDRTGVLAAVILGLAGVPKETIAYDYALSRIGVEPCREVLLAMLKLWNKEWTSETPGIREFSQVKAEFMMGTLEMVDGKYGSMEGYVKGELGFSGDDVDKMRKNMRGD